MLIDIDKVIVGDRIRKDFGDIQELADDISENGLINPPVVNKEYQLLAGERRLRACKLLGWPQIEVRMMDTRDAEHELNIEISENDVRKGFTKSERVDYIKRLLRIEQAKAKERQGERTSAPNNAEVKRSDEATAAQFDMSATTMRRELFIADNADLLDPADFADWDEGRLSTNKAFQRIKAAQEQAERERDEARKEASMAEWDAAELRRKLTEVRDEVEALQEQTQQEPQVIERTVEVAPADYSSIRHERDLYLSDLQRLRKSNEDMRRELDRAKDMLGMDKTLQDVRKDVQYLTSATNHYVRRYGGLTWTAESFGQVEPQALADLKKAAINLATFANALVASLEDFNG